MIHTDVVDTLQIFRNRVLEWDNFRKLGLEVDRYRTKEEPFQTVSKVVKTSQGKFHCVASVLLVDHIIGQSLTCLYI